MSIKRYPKAIDEMKASVELSKSVELQPYDIWIISPLGPSIYQATDWTRDGVSLFQYSGRRHKSWGYGQPSIKGGRSEKKEMFWLAQRYARSNFFGVAA